MSARRSGNQRGATVIGVALITLGVLFLVGQSVDLDLGLPTWPLYVIAAGLVIFALAFAVGGEPGAGVAAFGSVVTVVGGLLLYQQSTGHWESWAYAWALAAPGAVGLGIVLYGTLTRNRGLASKGWPLVGAGVAIFLVGALFFEGVLGLGGGRYRIVGDWLVPGLLVVLGVILIVRSLAGRR